MHVLSGFQIIPILGLIPRPPIQIPGSTCGPTYKDTMY